MRLPGGCGERLACAGGLKLRVARLRLGERTFLIVTDGQIDQLREPRGGLFGPAELLEREPLAVRGPPSLAGPSAASPR